MNDLQKLFTAIKDIAQDTLDQFFPLVGGLMVIIIIIAGLKYITGGPKAEESAKKTLIAVFVGIVIITLAVVIINMVINAISLNPI